MICALVVNPAPDAIADSQQTCGSLVAYQVIEGDTLWSIATQYPKEGPVSYTHLPLRLQALRMASPACAASREVDLERDRRSLRLSQQDLEDFSQSMERAFENLSERYYIALEGSPKVRVSHDAITVTFEIQKID